MSGQTLKEQLNGMVKSDQFWGDQPNVLLDTQRMVEFVPTKDMSRVEKINALARLVIFAGILLTLNYKDPIWLYITLVGMAFLYFVARNFPEQNGGGSVDTKEHGLNNAVDDYGNRYRKPTKDNPFMNVLLTDYVDEPQRPPAGDIDDPEIKAQVEHNFNQGLFKDVDDVWNRNNSQRQYVSNPGTTIPNDRDSFMKWCWQVPYVCKDGDHQACLKREDVRGHGQIV